MGQGNRPQHFVRQPSIVSHHVHRVRASNLRANAACTGAVLPVFLHRKRRELRWCFISRHEIAAAFASPAYSSSKKFKLS